MKTKYLIAMIEIIGISCIGIGISRIGEYFYKPEKAESIFVWKGTVGMAFSTSIIVTFIGIAFVLISIYMQRNESNR